MFTEEERKGRKREVDRRWREKNKEHIYEYKKKYYQEHREEIIERCKKRVLTPEQEEHKKEYGRKYQRKFYVENRETILEKKRKRKQSKEYSREYWRRNRKRLLEKKMRDRRNHPEKYRAHYILNNAINSGKIKRADVCEKCGREIQTEAHHYKGYAREYWFDVIWLCKSCHRIEDAKGGYSK